MNIKASEERGANRMFENTFYKICCCVWTIFSLPLSVTNNAIDPDTPIAIFNRRANIVAKNNGNLK